MTSSSTTTSSLKRQAAVSRSSTSRSSMSRSASVVAIAATVGDGSSNVGTVWTFVCPMSLLSTVVTDVIGFVTLLFPLELLDEAIELCMGEGARRGLRVLQVACWTPSLVPKCLLISVLSKATDISKGELTRDQVFIGLDLSHKSHHLQCLVEFFLLLEQGELVLVVAIGQQQVLDDLGVELVVIHSGCSKSFAALDDRETHLGDVLSRELLRLQTSHFLLHVFELFHGVTLEGLDEQHPNLQEAWFIRDAILDLPFQGFVQAVHEHQAGGSVVGLIVGIILGMLDGCC